MTKWNKDREEKSMIGDFDKSCFYKIIVDSYFF